MPATNLWTSLEEKWTADLTLQPIPLRTGKTQDEEDTASVRDENLPYATTFTVDDSPTERSSKGIYSQERIQFSVFHKTHAAARAAQVAIRNIFDDPALSLTLDDGTFISFLRESGGRIMPDAGTFHAFDIYVLTKSK